VALPEQLGPYTISRLVGEGGMGVVYAARDERLGRDVALKLLRQTEDELARRRFQREAQLAAGLEHPGICRVYDVGEERGQLYLAMELLAGESLQARLGRGPLRPREAIETVLAMLEPLAALHARGLVHRDLKPSNVFLTSEGVKLLDFGLARSMDRGGQAELTATALTEAGAVLGTPHYMSPEQLRGQALDARTDLYAAGAILFECVSGRRPFEGKNTLEALHATLHEQPPALSGSAAAQGLDRIVRRALSKRPEERQADAATLRQDLLAVLDSARGADTPRVVALTRLIVLPLRPLRADPDTDFLGPALADALAGSLASVESLVVRSSLAAARWADEGPDLEQLAREAEVDVALVGTLLRAGEQLRVSTQLLELPGGAVLWSDTSTAPLGDVFQLQDRLTARIVEAVAPTLTAREHRALRRDVPASARAYEYYLRAHPLSLEPASWDLARQMYEHCLEHDSDYAPAWARLGRVLRLLSKYAVDASGAERLARAEQALRRALELNPDLPLAHHYQAQLELELGRTEDAVARLLRLVERRGHDAEAFAGLVQACRYAGLLAPSLGAHERALRLDPTARTSVAFTLLLAARPLEALGLDPDPLRFPSSYALLDLGRKDEVRASCAELQARGRGNASAALELVRAAASDEPAAARDAVAALLASTFRDPEGFYFGARLLTRLGDLDLALELLRRACGGGFICAPALDSDPTWDALRAQPAFQELLARARARHRGMVAAYAELGGESLLGPA